MREEDEPTPEVQPPDASEARITIAPAGSPQDGRATGFRIATEDYSELLGFRRVGGLGFGPALFGDSFVTIASDMTRHLSSIMTGALDPVQARLGSQITSLFDGFGLNRLATSMMPDISSLLPGIDSLIGDHFRDVFKTLRRLPPSKSWPSNWREIDPPDTELLDRLVLDEGLPLAWVPPVDVIERLLTAGDAQARRDVIGRFAARILSACASQLAHITSPTGRTHARFASAAIRAIEGGHREAGQALATNAIDTIARQYLGYWRTIPDKNQRPDLQALPLRDALVLGAIWRAYDSYVPGSQPPRSFGRHPSAHGVSSRQYNLRNATLAAMHLVALLRLLEQEGWQPWAPVGTKNRKQSVPQPAPVR